ncbi:MAG: hypothetical protein WBQ14_01135 [Gaiellaceae bacterium]
MAVAAALTGPFLGLGLLAPNSFWIAATAAAGWLACAGGLIVWSGLPDARAMRSRLGHGAAAFAFAMVALLVIGLPTAVWITYRCPEGEGVSFVHPLGLLGLLIPGAYYAIGYWGFQRPRRLLYAWPLAIVSALFILILLELILKDSGGCVSS